MANRGNAQTQAKDTDTRTTAEGHDTKGMININTCKAEHIATLPQMTGSRASSIINHRKTFGAFTSMKRVTDVPGISEELVKALIPHCYAGDVDAPSEREAEIDANM